MFWGFRIILEHSNKNLIYKACQPADDNKPTYPELTIWANRQKGNRFDNPELTDKLAGGCKSIGKYHIENRGYW